MSSIKAGLGDVIPSPELSSLTFDGGLQEEAKLTGYELVASYNWTNLPKPTIIVPGAPNVWTPKPVPMRVPQDTGKVFVDQNRARFPDYPLEPLIRSVNLVNKDFVLSGVDVVTDRNNLRKMYRWVSRSRELEDFRIDAELAGNTVLFTRWESKAEETIVGFRGFGHEYEKANTRPAEGCDKSTGHHRIVTYMLGDVKLLVRYEVDACFKLKEDANVKIAVQKDQKKNTEASGGSGDPADLLAALGAMKISEAPQAFEGSKLHFIRNGILVDQSEVLELKTRVQHKALDWEDTWPQLYFSQTPTLLLAKHLKGQFGTPERTQLSSLENYVRRNQKSILLLKNALERMKSLVLKHGKGNAGLAFICQNGTMWVYFRKAGDGNTKVDPLLLELFTKKASGTNTAKSPPKV